MPVNKRMRSNKKKSSNRSNRKNKSISKNSSRNKSYFHRKRRTNRRRKSNKKKQLGGSQSNSDIMKKVNNMESELGNLKEQIKNQMEANEKKEKEEMASSGVLLDNSGAESNHVKDQSSNNVEDQSSNNVENQSSNNAQDQSSNNVENQSSNNVQVQQNNQSNTGSMEASGGFFGGIMKQAMKLME